MQSKALNRHFRNHAASFGVAIAGALGACSGQDGATGPLGPAGQDGEPGAMGLQGEAGPAGSDGTTGATGATGAPGLQGEQGLQGEPGIPANVNAPRLLRASTRSWAGDNRTRLNEMVLQYGIVSSTFDPENPPVAVLDWDNTMIKNDIGDATFAWIVRHDKILQPPNRDWSVTNANLSTTALTALNSGCDAAAEPGAPLPTSTTPACASALMNIYYNAGSVSWSNELTATNNQPYAWVAQLLAGYTPAEIRSFARAAFDQNVNAAIGTTQTVGGITLAGYIRIYSEMSELVAVLQHNGFDVWVLTASPQYVVDAISDEAGVDTDRVIGIRNVLVDGKTTYALQGCGGVADGENTLITFYDGKRCWINKVIYGELAENQLAPNPDLAKRPVFVAGDSNTDVSMLKDATALKLAIDRNKVELMCNAYANYLDRWLIQPMFISPRSVPASYACSTTTAVGGDAIIDEAGVPIADQSTAP
jgi:hypothetical protein